MCILGTNQLYWDHLEELQYTSFNIENVPDDWVILPVKAGVHFINICGGDKLDLGDDLVLVAEVDALLGVRKSSYCWSRDDYLVRHEWHLVDRVVVHGHSDLYDGAFHCLRRNVFDNLYIIDGELFVHHKILRLGQQSLCGDRGTVPYHQDNFVFVIFESL